MTDHSHDTILLYLWVKDAEGGGGGGVGMKKMV